MKLKLSQFLMRLALRLIAPGPLSAREPMDDEAVTAALCVPPTHPVYRACMELLHRHAERFQAEAFAERNVARNAIKTTFYVASAGSIVDASDYIEEIRRASMAGREPRGV